MEKLPKVDPNNNTFLRDVAILIIGISVLFVVCSIVCKI